MKKLICLLTSLGALAFSGAHADNFYAGAFGGANWVQNSKHHNHYKTGYILGLDAGYKWCNGLRTEFEFAYRSNQNKRHGSSSNHSHRNQSYAGMFNLLYDFDAWGCWCVRPFIGGGIGVASVRRNHGGSSHSANGETVVLAEGEEISAPEVVGSSGGSHNKRRSSFAWQLIAGLAYPLNDCVDIDLSYRFFKTSEDKINNNSLVLGLNYNF